MSDGASMPCVSVFILTVLSLGGSHVNNSVSSPLSPVKIVLQGYESLNVTTDNTNNKSRRLELYDNTQFFDFLLRTTKYNPRVRPDTTVEVEDWQKCLILISK